MRRRIVWINIGLAALLVLVVGIALATLAPQSAEQTGRTIPAQLGTVSETVTATGTVETAGTVKLSFPTSGVVAEVDVREGDVVSADEVLASLDDTSQQQAVAAAQSTYVQAVANAGTAPLTLAAAQRNLVEAERVQRINKASYAQSVAAARDSLDDARTSWSEACLTPTGTCPDDSVWAQLRAAEAAVVNAQTAYDQAVQNATVTAETNQIKLGQAQVNVDAARSSQSTQCSTYGSTSTPCTTAVDAFRAAEQAYALQLKANQTAAVTAQQSLVNADAGITSANVSLRKLQSTLRSTASDAVRTAQSALDTALITQRKGLEVDQQTVDAAREAVAQQSTAQQSVDVEGSTLTPADAAVQVAEAGVVAAEAALEDTVLTAPVSGTAAAIEIEAGESVTPSTVVMTIIPDAPLEIVAEFPEADALTLALGQSAVVSFDALPGTTATGTVTSIALLPTETTTASGASAAGRGVTTYKATIALDSAPDGVREGMSTSVVVTTKQVDDVVWVPTAAITTVDGRSTVTIREGDVDRFAEITTGLVGDNGTEVSAGVKPGDELVIEVGEPAPFTGFEDGPPGDGNESP